MNIQKIRQGVIIIVRNKDGKYLILRQKKDNSYSCISGGIEEGEDFIDAAIREAKEEAGLTLQRKDLQDTNLSISFVSGKGSCEQRVLYLKTDSSVDIKVDNLEISGYKWMTKQEAVKSFQLKPPLPELIEAAEACW